MLGGIGPRKEIVEGSVVRRGLFPYPRSSLDGETVAKFHDFVVGLLFVLEGSIPGVLNVREGGDDAVDDGIRCSEQCQVEQEGGKDSFEESHARLVAFFGLRSEDVDLEWGGVFSDATGDAAGEDGEKNTGEEVADGEEIDHLDEWKWVDERLVADVFLSVAMVREEERAYR